VSRLLSLVAQAALAEPLWRYASASSANHGAALGSRSVKYEDLYLRGYESVPELERGLRAYFAFYNGERLHRSLGL
jgi:hypothetical protein